MNSAIPPGRILATPTLLSIEWVGGEVSEFDSLWLRDNSPDDRDPHNGQRLVDIVELPAEPRIRSAVVQGASLIVEWESEARRTSFTLEWLARHAGEPGAATREHAVQLWLEGGTLDAARDFAWRPLRALRGDPAARARWLDALLGDGIAFLSEVPCTESALLDVVASIGRIAETNYGRTFDVRSVPQPENLAYSDAGLGLHTDNPYREPVPGFQALHALAVSPEGGESLFADGFALAEHLRATAPEAFGLLTRRPVPFRYQSKDADLYAERPLIQLTCEGRLSAVHYNSRSIAPLNLPARDVRPFYAAYRAFAALLREPRFQMRLRLAQGELVVFDNQRILHGRTAYSSAQHARHLRGCYLTRDSVRSEAALLQRRLRAGEAA